VLRKVFDFFLTYIFHPDPVVRATNLVAVVVALNGPFYPLSGIAVMGSDGVYLFIFMLFSPLFFAIPWISKYSSLSSRILLPFIGMADAVVGTTLFGAVSGMSLYVLPCLALCGFLYRPHEKVAGFLLLAVGIAIFLIPSDLYADPVFSLSSGSLSQLFTLNLISVGMLIGLIALQTRSLFAIEAK